MQYVADVMDLEEQFNMEDFGHSVSSVVAPHPVKRAPENIWEAMELSIPFLRQNISER
jgi:predicted metalloenzyme YecM